MAWNLTDEQQHAIMDAVSATILPYRERNVPSSYLWQNEDGSTERRPMMLPGWADDTPAEIRNLGRVFDDIVDSWFTCL